MTHACSAISTATGLDLPRLFEVWESSVRATHSFLTESDLQMLMPLVRTELANFRPIHCLRDGRGSVVAFVGVAGSKIEMLFVHADARGGGAGRRLAEFAVQVLGAVAVDVNEQNSPAIGFYHHLGFRQAGRSAVDPAGNPFPILHLALPGRVPYVSARSQRTEGGRRP